MMVVRKKTCNRIVHGRIIEPRANAHFIVFLFVGTGKEEGMRRGGDFVLTGTATGHQGRRVNNMCEQLIGD
jgi:hypothetical protein